MKYGFSVQWFVGDVQNHVLKAPSQVAALETGARVKGISAEFWRAKWQGESRIRSVSFSGLESLGDNALRDCFKNCPNIETAVFESLSVLDGAGALYCAFQNNAALREVLFPALSSIEHPTGGENARGLCYECHALEGIGFPVLETVSAYRGMYDAFRNCAKLTAVSFPMLRSATGTDAFREAFYGCAGIVTVNFPTLKTVGAGVFLNAFYNNAKLEAAGFNALETAGDHAFNSAFQNCTKLKEIHFPALTSIGGSTFYSAFQNSGLEQDIEIDFSTIPGSAFELAFAGTKVTSANFPRVNAVNSNSFKQAFQNCTQLRSVAFPALVECGGDNSGFEQAFAGCTALTDVDFSALQSVSGWLSRTCLARAWSGCTALKRIAFPKLALVHGADKFSSAFENCTALETADFSKLATITTAYNYKNFDNAFKGCTKLASVDFSALATVGGADLLSHAFEGCELLARLDFPSLASVASTSFTTMLAGSSVEEVHFPAAMQSAIEALDGYDTCFGAGAGAVDFYFDLGLEENNDAE